MHTPASKRVRWIAAIVFHVALIGGAARPATAQAKPISQTRINEYAAALLKVHRALIEDGDLRRPGEKLDDFMRRIVTGQPAESKDHYIQRLGSYFEALRSLRDRSKLCMAIPALHDTSPANVDRWKRAVGASTELPDRWERVRVAWTHADSGGTHELVRGPNGMAAELTKAVFTIKTAFEALREARP